MMLIPKEAHRLVNERDEYERLRLRCAIAVHGDRIRTLGLCLYFAGAWGDAQARRMIGLPLAVQHLEAFYRGEGLWYVTKLQAERLLGLRS